MVNWKVVLWSAAGGFVLSFFVGVVGGVMFGPLLLRAILWSVVFALLGSAAYYVISRFLPEILGSTEEPEKGTGVVDIVLPGDNPHEKMSDSFAEELPERDGESWSGERSAGEMAEEVEELRPVSGEGSAANEDSQTSAATESDDDFFSEIQEERSSSVEELPEFESETNEFSGGAPAKPRSAGRGAPVDLLGGKADPEEVARAIRTVLKKDQKG